MTTGTQVASANQYSERVSLLLVDSNTLLREGLRHLLTATQFDVTHEASDLTEALEVVRSDRSIGIVVLDFNENGADQELQILREMRFTNRGIKLVVLTNEVSINLMARSLSAGVDGYLLKSLSSSALGQSLRLIELGEKVLTTKLATMITGGQLAPTEAEARVSSAKGLSGREREVLRCLNEGHSNKVIARRLDITEATVKVHLKTVMRKLNVANRTQAAIWAVHQGLGGDTA